LWSASRLSLRTELPCVLAAMKIPSPLRQEICAVHK
jgi:hypothetical protein